MAWPNPNEYVEAIQYPRQAFSDPDLRGGKVVTNKLGLPRPISGNFATVFEVETDACKWAVRCFLREVTNQQDRYAAISEHLKRHPLPFMVNFEYLPEGIRVRGKWFPILKMDWTPGIRLDTYIEQNLNAPQKLRRLGERWLALCRSLRMAEIAHGDLQHGNILVTDDDAIKLIDYDGMIVPSVIGLTNNEIGHRHYQHPTRSDGKDITGQNFRSVDNFSTIVIGLSLLALSVDTSLWKKTQAGEENLLFRASDFETPEQSPALDLLARHSDPRIRASAAMLREAAHAPSYLDVPPFEQNPLDTPVTQLTNRLLDWVAERLPSSVTVLTPATSEAMKSSWIFDHLKQDQVDFTDEFLQHERHTAELAFERSILRPVRQVFPLFALVTFAWRYSTYPQVLEKASAARTSRDLQQQLIDAKARRKTLSRLIVEADRRYQQQVRVLESSAAELHRELEISRQQENREVMRLERALHSTTHELLGQRLEAGRINGIGAAQIEALALVGIRTAADITPANEATALSALNGVDHAVPRGDWERLMDWRRRNVPPITEDDVENVHTRYAHNQESLERQIETVEIQLLDAREQSPDLDMVQSLYPELSDAEAEVTTLQRQHLRAEYERNRYNLITLPRFLWKMIAPPAG
ncbi:MAG: hypothetical protein IT319_11610 [Anaerolineae bacterium]|nr:hypothetical protein [Anaerolineae bacterium]